MFLDNFFLMAAETFSMFWYLVIVFTFKVYKIHMIYIQKKWIILNDVKSKRKVFSDNRRNNIKKHRNMLAAGWFATSNVGLILI